MCTLGIQSRPFLDSIQTYHHKWDSKAILAKKEPFNHLRLCRIRMFRDGGISVVARAVLTRKWRTGGFAY